MANTKHGHHIPGSPEVPRSSVDCPGYESCRECVDEAYNWEPEPEVAGMAIEDQFTTFVRKPFTVQAIRVTRENIHELSMLLGELREPPDEDPFIRVDKKRVPNVYNVKLGYWVTKMGPQIRAYNPDVFEQQFREYSEVLEDFFIEHDLLDDSISART